MEGGQSEAGPGPTVNHRGRLVPFPSSGRHAKSWIHVGTKKALFSTDGSFEKTTTMPANSDNNAEDGELHISGIQRLELKNGKQREMKLE